MSHSKLLRADVHVAPSIPWFKPNLKVGGPWSPISCTLIHSMSEAALVDTPITITQTLDLINWIKDRIPTKLLTTIYITHGHGDHFFGIPLLVEHFPHARVFATRATLAHMKEQLAPGRFKIWDSQFPGQIPANQMAALERVEIIPPSNEICLEGHVFRVVEVGQADTIDSTVLWVPDLKLAVCGDVVYGDVHQMLAETDTKEKRRQWIESIGKVEALGPELVVPGHQSPKEVNGVFHLRNTASYLQSFDEFIDAGAKDARELSQLMVARWPTRFNTGALVASCIAAFKANQATRERSNKF